MQTIRNIVRAQSLEEAYTLNQKRTNEILGGMLWLKMSKSNVQTAIDLSDLGLDTVEEDEECFRIGAMVTLRTLEKHEALNRYCDGAFELAVRDIVGVQFRNMATIGGSVWGRFGFSDVLTVLMSMDCCVELYKGGIIPLEEFAAQKYDRDILVRVIIKKTPGRFAYKAMRAQRTDFPVLTCAVSCMEGRYKAVIGARPGKARAVYDEENILAGGAGDEAIGRFADYVAKKIPTGSNLRGSAAYRKQLAKVLTTRALQEITGRE